MAHTRHSRQDSGLGFKVPGRGAARAEDAQGTPTQSHISPSILVYEDKGSKRVRRPWPCLGLSLYHSLPTGAFANRSI